MRLMQAITGAPLWVKIVVGVGVILVILFLLAANGLWHIQQELDEMSPPYE